MYFVDHISVKGVKIYFVNHIPVKGVTSISGSCFRFIE